MATDLGFLDGDLQFSSLDEHRYHEALVHPALSLHERPARVLLLGAGDGLALRASSRPSLWGSDTSIGAAIPTKWTPFRSFSSAIGLLCLA